MEEEEVGTGSIADFIDRTILRCLIEYDRAMEQSPETKEAEKQGHESQTEECQSWVLPHQRQAHGHQNQACECQTLTCQDHAVEHQRQCQKCENQAVGLHEHSMEPRIQGHRDSNSTSAPLLSSAASVEMKTRDDAQLSHPCDCDCARSKSSTSPPSDEPQDLRIPGCRDVGKDLNLRQLSGTSSEGASQKQRISEPIRYVLPQIGNDNASDRHSRSERRRDTSLSSRPVLLQLMSARDATELRNIFIDASPSQSFAAAKETYKADTDSVEKSKCPCQSAEVDSDVSSNHQGTSGCVENTSRELDSSADEETHKMCGVRYSTDGSSLRGHNQASNVAKSGSCDRGGGQPVPQETCAGLGASADSKEKNAQLSSVVCREVVSVAAPSAAEDAENLKGNSESGLDEVVHSDATHAQQFQSEYKATDKVKKRLQKRYFEAGSEEESTPVETFRYDGGKVSNWRIKKWKKRRLQSAEDGDKAGSKSEKSKQKSPGKPKKQQKTKEESQLEDLEQPGFIEYSSDEEADRLSQREIAEAVDVSSATKYFELNLTDFGPYSINYSRNGRHLLLGGERGHVAAFEWQTKRLAFELNTDHINSIRWLHQETMFAAAHPSGVCFYDNLGIELHALTDLDAVLRMEFLPHHMLLATANEKGFLGYTDVSMGTRAAGICTGLGRLDVMTQNPANAVIHLGHAAGTVTLWAPSVKGPLVKILTHKAPVRALAIDSTGNYMATSGVDKRLKIFDLRTYKMLNKLKVPQGASSLAFSQQGLLAAALGNCVQVYKDCKGSTVTPYLSHVTNGSLRSVQFCPFEDVLGAGHQRGFSSLIVPGSGDANYNALSVNPMANKKQRQNVEVRLLLDKLQPEMIGLTNWVWELANKSSAQKAPQPVAKKLGKKQKEELQREKIRESQKERKKQADQETDSDPLSRFRKSKS